MDLRVSSLVGRSEELKVVERALSSGARGGIVLMGAVGVGKTRLARELLDRTCGPSHEGRAVWVSGTRSGLGVPFGAFAHLLPSLDAAGLDRLAVMMQARRAVLQSAGDGPRLLVVDDAHLLDDASASLVHQLAMTRALRMVVTVRSGEPAPDAVVALWKDDWLDCLDLQALDRLAIRELVCGLVGGQVDGRAVARIWEQTRGNALFCCELVRAALAADVLQRDREVWRWRGTLPRTGRIWDLIDAHLSDLRVGDLAALEVIAVGDGADVALLDGLVDSANRLALVRHGLVVEQTEGARSVVRVAHPLFSEAVRARMPEARRRAVCGRLALAAEERGLAAGPELLRVAGWRLQHGGDGDPRLFLAAARRAQAGFDSRLAERFSRAAIACSGGFEAERMLATALGAQGEVVAAEQIFARLEREAEDDGQQGKVAAKWSEMLFLNGGRSADAARLVARVRRELPPSALHDELRVLEANWAWLSGESWVFDRLDEWLEMGQRSERMSMLVAFAIAPMQVGAGQTEAALGTLDRSAEAASHWREALPTVELALRMTRTYALWSAGRLNEDLEYCEREWAAALEAGEPEPMAMFAFARGGALTDIGRVDSAGQALRDALSTFEELDTPLYVSWVLAFLARARALAGDASGARDALERARRARPSQIRLMDPELESAGVWVSVAEGQISRARDLSLALGAAHTAAGRPVAAARALHDAARLGGAAAAAGPLNDLSAAIDGPVVELYAGHASSLAASDAPGLVAAGTGFSELGCQLWGAEAYAAAAAAFESSGRSQSARAAAARASALLVGCEGVRTPLLARAAMGSSLTARERDVAVLAADGLPNREIARRLVVSIRTVESHLAQTYRKLGINNRDELADLVAAKRPEAIARQTAK